MLSKRILLEAGRTMPQTRLITINRNPSARSLRRKRTSSCNSGHTLRRCSLGFFFFETGDTAISLTDAGMRLRVAKSGERGFDAEHPRRRSSSFIERGNLGVVAQAVGERKVEAVNFNVETRR